MEDFDVKYLVTLTLNIPQLLPGQVDNLRCKFVTVSVISQYILFII